MTSEALYPTGMIVLYDDETYLVSGQKLFPFISLRAAMSWSQPVIDVDEELIEDNYDIMEKMIGYRPTSIISTIGGNIKYFVDGVHRRQISDEAIMQFFKCMVEPIYVNTTELSFHIEGAPIG